VGQLVASFLGTGDDSGALFIDGAWREDEDVECRENEETIRVRWILCSRIWKIFSSDYPRTWIDKFN
jgi:hypothetical protein